MESPSLEFFKECADVALGSWFDGAGTTLGLDDPEGVFQP